MSYLTTKNQYLITKKGQLKIAYREMSQGKSEIPLVLLGHLAGTLDNWDPKLIDLLAQKQHLILFDLPGVGASQGTVAASISAMADAAIDIISSLGWHKVNLLGLSMGGMIAQEIVKKNSFLVQKLILAGTAPKSGLGLTKVTKITFRHMLKASFTKEDPKRYIFYNHDTQGRQHAHEVLARMNARTEAFLDAPMKVQGFLRQLKAIKVWAKEKENILATIKQETLIINGDNDLEVATQNSYVMHQQISNSRLIIYPNAGHGALFQYAKQCSQDILSFLEGDLS